MKLIAFYLPQFHTIPENDKWWGKGFTDWVNTKKAKKISNKQRQPRVPYQERYYDLTNSDELKWQMDVAREYGLDGFCFYHYWFDGKLLLEKPVEIMRTLPERIPYCLCWANEPWSRTWDGTHSVLIEQKYRGQEDWEAHYRYFLKYFNDDKYIKADNCPVLVIYRTNDIPKCDDMIHYWDLKCKEDGFDGIYVIEEVNSFQHFPSCKLSKAFLEFEPMYTTSAKRKFIERCIDYTTTRMFRLVNHSENILYSYDRIWKNIVSREHASIGDKKNCPGGFVDWDNTARKGKKSIIFNGANPEKFKRYLTQLMTIARRNNSPFVFINAWNEWGEGTYLEPDTDFGFSYLEAIKDLNNED